MPAVVQHLSGLVDSLRRRVGRRDARRARHADAGRARQLRRPGQDPGRAGAGGRGRRHDRAGVRDRGRAGRGDRRAPRHPAARRRPRQPRLRGQGLRACGWAAGRSSSASTPSRCPRCSSELAPADVELPRLPRLRRLAEPQRRDPLRGPAQDGRAGAAARRRTPRRPSATSTSAAASASRTSTATSRSTSTAIGDNLERPARRRASARACPTRGSSSSSAATSSASAASTSPGSSTARSRAARRSSSSTAACTTSSPRRATSAR